LKATLTGTNARKASAPQPSIIRSLSSRLFSSSRASIASQSTLPSSTRCPWLSGAGRGSAAAEVFAISSSRVRAS
jgi:hypothetical protein